MALGSYKNPRCTYWHDTARIKGFIDKLQPGVDAMKKRKRGGE
jgi:hypothetical protein